MRSEPARRFFAKGALVAAGSGAVLAAVAAGTGASLPWAMLGWALPSALGLMGGVWLAALHGSAGHAFLVALGVGLLSRLLVLTLAAAGAALAGGAAIVSYGLGLGVGFLSMLTYEAVWFVLADRRRQWSGGAIDG